MTVALPSAYLVANTLLIAAFAGIHAYFVYVKPHGSPYGRFQDRSELDAWERQCLMFSAVVVAWKALRRRSWAHFTQQCFFYGKLLTALTALMVDLRLLAWYAFTLWAAYIACPQDMALVPRGAADADEAVTHLTPAKLKERVLSARTDGAAWVVFFYSEHHQPSTAMAPAFTRLAATHASEHLRFGALDATLWPRFSRELRLSASAWSSQLPAVVLYDERGVERARLPAQKDLDELGLRKNHFTAEQVVRTLGLKALAAGVGVGAPAAAVPGGRGTARGVRRA